ncbi:hypothetical protein TcWFU_008998 [Taenia crassiceps]|uniref:Uncharacterized protein n=1 Tax=Taenia crassiceps TaxID=6207 RepID=A0ABR4Q595_9CEST
MTGVKHQLVKIEIQQRSSKCVSLETVSTDPSLTSANFNKDNSVALHLITFCRNWALQSAEWDSIAHNRPVRGRSYEVFGPDKSTIAALKRRLCLSNATVSHESISSKTTTLNVHTAFKFATKNMASPDSFMAQLLPLKRWRSVPRGVLHKNARNGEDDPVTWHPLSKRLVRYGTKRWPRECLYGGLFLHCKSDALIRSSGSRKMSAKLCDCLESCKN